VDAGPAVRPSRGIPSWPCRAVGHDSCFVLLPVDASTSAHPRASVKFVPLPRAW
jgi:hypothetical protein